jgi:hypothetical protein
MRSISIKDISKQRTSFKEQINFPKPDKFGGASRLVDKNKTGTQLKLFIGNKNVRGAFKKSNGRFDTAVVLPSLRSKYRGGGTSTMTKSGVVQKFNIRIPKGYEPSPDGRINYQNHFPHGTVVHANIKVKK